MPFPIEQINNLPDYWRKCLAFFCCNPDFKHIPVFISAGNSFTWVTIQYSWVLIECPTMAIVSIFAGEIPDIKDMSKKSNKNRDEAKKRISKDRKRTNILREPEQAALAWLVQRMPGWITSDGLTFIGLSGNMIVGLSFVLAAYFHINWLFLSIFGFIVNWLGDSLDGRLAYYRNKPRKWYGFALDVTVDWIGIILIGVGFMHYVGSPYYLLGFMFVVLYGWEMITALLRYKVIGKYSIDSGIMGPTEVRIIIAALMVMEVFIPGSIILSILMVCGLLMIANVVDAIKLTEMADKRDKDENMEKEIRRVLASMDDFYRSPIRFEEIRNEGVENNNSH